MTNNHRYEINQLTETDAETMRSLLNLFNVL
jgi:hypothetical protein